MSVALPLLPTRSMSRCVLGLALLTIVGCSAGTAGSTVAGDEAAFTAQGPVLDRLPANTLLVPLIRQKVDYSCGDVSTLSVLRYWKYADYKSTKESDLFAPLKTTKHDGTDPKPITDYLNGVPGLSAELRTGDAVTLTDLEEAVDRGEPTIVDLQAWQDVPRVRDRAPWANDWDDGHYIVLVGYDAENFYYMDPSTAGHYTYIPKDQFFERWHDVVGKTNVHTDHITIFVHSTTAPHAATSPSPTKVTIIN